MESRFEEFSGEGSDESHMVHMEHLECLVRDDWSDVRKTYLKNNTMVTY